MSRADLFAANIAAKPLAIRVFPGWSGRIIAEIFPRSDGLVFADISWPFAPPSHPFHIVEGDILDISTGLTPDHWLIGEAEVFILEGPNDPLWSEWEQWRDWRETSEGKLATRELAEEQMTEYGFLGEGT